MRPLGLLLLLFALAGCSSSPSAPDTPDPPAPTPELTPASLEATRLRAVKAPGTVQGGKAARLDLTITNTGEECAIDPSGVIRIRWNTVVWFALDWNVGHSGARQWRGGESKVIRFRVNRDRLEQYANRQIPQGGLEITLGNIRDVRLVAEYESESC